MNRFSKMEELISKEKKQIGDYSLDELDIFWNEVKE